MLAFPIAFNIAQGRPLNRNVRDHGSATWKTCYLQKTAEGLLLSMSSAEFVRSLHTIVLSFWTQIAINFILDIGFYPVVDVRRFIWWASQQEVLE